MPETHGEMRTGATRSSRLNTPADVGTLWTLRFHGQKARCALLAWPAEWELRVVVENRTLLAEFCDRLDDAVALADQWKSRLLDEGWQQIVPRIPSQRPGR